MQSEYPVPMRRFLFRHRLCALALAALSCRAPKQAAEAPLFRPVSFDAALQAAAAEKKIVMLDFVSASCPPCGRMDLTTWRDAAVAGFLRTRAVALRIDGDADHVLVSRYRINYYPTMLLLDANGAVIDRLTGYKSPEKFISEFSDSLAGKTTLKRAQADAAIAKNDPEKGPQARLDLDDALVEEGRYSEALRDYLWLYDKGMKGSVYSDLRTSYLLYKIKILGRRYPPAVEALKRRRDAAQELLRAPAVKDDDVDEFCSLDDSLGEKAHTLAVFDSLTGGGAARKRLGRCVFDQLIAGRRYAEAVEFRSFEEAERDLESDRTLYWGSKSDMDAETLRGLRALSVEETAQRIEAFAGSGKLDEAREIMRRLAALDDSPETRGVVQSHLRRCGQSDLRAR